MVKELEVTLNHRPLIRSFFLLLKRGDIHANTFMVSIGDRDKYIIYTRSHVQIPTTKKKKSYRFIDGYRHDMTEDTI